MPQRHATPTSPITPVPAPRCFEPTLRLTAAETIELALDKDVAPKAEADAARDAVGDGKADAEVALAPGRGVDWTLLGAGDWASVRCFENVAARSPEAVYGALLEPIQAADLSLVNLECALGGTRPLLKDGPNLQGDPASARHLRDAGFDLACLGNNHVLDYGAAGLQATLDACAAAGLPTTGAGSNTEEAYRPAIVERGGVRIGVLSLADREEGDATADRPGVAPIFDIHVLDRVRAVRAAVDVLILVLHGGKEYVPVPPPYWVERVLAVAACGADLVIGHHPHVPQGITMLERDPSGPDALRPPIPVLFSIGNFVFRPAAADGVCIPPRTADGYLVQARFAGARLAGVELIPYGIVPEDGPRRLTGAQAEAFADLLAGMSAPLADRRAVADWFDAVTDHFWTHQVRERLRGLTEKSCAGDREAIRHARSHHNSPTHLTLIDNALQRILSGALEAGEGDAAIRARLAGWFAGRWPVPPVDPATHACAPASATGAAAREEC